MLHNAALLHRWAFCPDMSGVVPAKIAASFTMGEVAPHWA